VSSSVTESIDVHVPIDKAYNQWTQFEDFPKFMSGVDSITQKDDRHLHWQVTLNGVTREFDAEITEQRPEERIAWKSTDGTTHSGVVTFHKLADSDTRVTVQLEWQPEGIVEKAGSVVGVDKHQVSKDLDRFKDFIENRPAETGAWRGEVPRDS
jgi:uncharacterized membrane protein